MKKAEDNFSKEWVDRIGGVVGEIIGMVIGGIILWYVFPWLPFVIDGYQAWLPIGFGAMIGSGVLKIMAYMVWVIAPLVRLLRIFSHVLSGYSTYVLWRLFPFDFGLVGVGWLNFWFGICLIVAMWGIGIAVVVELVKLVTGAPVGKGKLDGN